MDRMTRVSKHIIKEYFTFMVLFNCYNMFVAASLHWEYAN